MTQEVLRQLTSKTDNSTEVEGVSVAEDAPDSEPRSSTLIEFPGASRAIPEWRRQLSQRVREVQERKAREAAEELAAAREAGLVSASLPSGQLELVADLERPAMNPIVSKALERIDRARRNDSAQFAATAAALAPDLKYADESMTTPIVDQKPKLTVVAPAVITQPTLPEIEPSATLAEGETIAPVEEIASPESITQDEPQAELVTEAMQDRRKPVRLISDDDISLSYLDTCLSVPALVDDSRANLASLTRRTIAGIFDLILMGLMVAPAAAFIQYSGGNWADRRVIEVMAGITAATMFAYLTISTAMTGRTLAMKMFALRTIDLHTGLIPTGGQSIKRALSHVFSFAFLGLGLAYAVIDPDQRTVPDRFSQTIVIRD